MTKFRVNGVEFTGQIVRSLYGGRVVRVRIPADEWRFSYARQNFVTVLSKCEVISKPEPEFIPERKCSNPVCEKVAIGKHKKCLSCRQSNALYMRRKRQS